MKNRTLAIFGIGTYILTILSSATDLEGYSVVPLAFIVISGIATFVFYIMATFRLWKAEKGTSILFISSAIIPAIFFTAQEGTLLLVVVNIVR